MPPVTEVVDTAPLGTLVVGKSDGPAEAELLEGSPAVYDADPFEGADDGPLSGVP